MNYQKIFIAVGNVYLNGGGTPSIYKVLQEKTGGALPDLPAFFFDCPASTKYHGSEKGGLFTHCFEVARQLCGFTDALALKWQRPESPLIVGMLHDLCKFKKYKPNGAGGYEYDKDALMPDHGAYSVILAQQLGADLTDEEIACIRWHMGAFEKNPQLWGYYTGAVKKYPNVLYTHTADMVASHINGT